MITVAARLLNLKRIRGRKRASSPAGVIYPKRASSTVVVMLVGYAVASLVILSEVVAGQPRRASGSAPCWAPNPGTALFLGTVRGAGHPAM